MWFPLTISGNTLTSYIANDANTVGNVYQTVTRNGNTTSTIAFPNGRVGIGTTSPAYPLQVVGGVEATGFYYSSDRNLKENIEPLSSQGPVLDRLDSIHGVYFSWKNNGERSLGVLAQDVDLQFPELVGKKDKYWTVNYGGLSALAIEGLKEEDHSLSAAKARIATLEKENSRLAHVVETLAARLSRLEKALAPKGEQ